VQAWESELLRLSAGTWHLVRRSDLRALPWGSFDVFYAPVVFDCAVFAITFLDTQLLSPQAVSGEEEVASSGSKCVVWLSCGDIVMFLSGNDEHGEFALIEAVRALKALLQSVTKTKEACSEKALIDHYPKILLYLDEMITPTGQVQHLEYNEMRKMVKMEFT
jgi:hypothetical protein